MKIMMITLTGLLIFIGSSSSAWADVTLMTMDSVAESYVKLALQIDLYDPGYVDAYIGPADWRPTKNQEADVSIPGSKLTAWADGLIGRLDRLDPSEMSPLRRLRYDYLHRQLVAARFRVEQLAGKRLTFDEESKALYDVVAPPYDPIVADSLLKRLDSLVPGEGSRTERLARFLARYEVPKEKLNAVASTAMAEVRRRTQQHIELPAGEALTLEYVDNQAWGAYNWFKGNGRSLIQINTDMPMRIRWIVGLVAHEAYPGHHVHLSMLEKHLYRDSNWVEFSVFPLYCPFGVILEGMANYAPDLVFAEDERIEYEKRVLFPLADLDTTEIERYVAVERISVKLEGSRIDIARAFVDGKLSRQAAIDALTERTVVSPKEAAQLVEFFEKYRSYIVCYTLGERLVREFMDKHQSSVTEGTNKWRLFQALLTTPRTPSTLK